MLLQKEEKLRVLRSGSRITLGEVDVPEDEQLDEEVRLTGIKNFLKSTQGCFPLPDLCCVCLIFLAQGVLAVVREAVKAAEDQILASLTQEASLLSDILQLKLQQAALATRGLPNPVSSSSGQIGSGASSTADAARKTGLK